MDQAGGAAETRQAEAGPVQAPAHPLHTAAAPPHLSGLPVPRAGAAGRPPCAQRAAGCPPRCRSPAVKSVVEENHTAGELFYLNILV